MRTLADLGALEETRNPDAGIDYVFRVLDEECAAEVPEGFPSATAVSWSRTPTRRR